MPRVALLEFLALIAHSLLGCQTHHYTFETEIVKEILLVPINFEPTEDILKNPLYKLNPNEQRSLCEDAKKFTPLGEMEPYKVIDPVDKFEVAYLDGTTAAVIGLACSTKPAALLRVGDSENEIRVMLEDQFLSPYSFTVESVVSISALREDFPEKTIHRHELYTLSLHERRQLCHGARLYTSAHKKETHHVPDQAAGYEITDRDHKKRTSVGVSCPTSPSFYLFLTNKDEVNIVSANEFLENRFQITMQVVEFAVKGEPATSHVSLSSALSRWHLCLAAKQRNQIALPVHWIKPFGNIAVYNILSPARILTKRIAFECSTSPKGMMLMASDSENDFVVMIVRYPNPFF